MGSYSYLWIVSGGVAAGKLTITLYHQGCSNSGVLRTINIYPDNPDYGVLRVNIYVTSAASRVKYYDINMVG